MTSLDLVMHASFLARVCADAHRAQAQPLSPGLIDRLGDVRREIDSLLEAHSEDLKRLYADAAGMAAIDAAERNDLEVALRALQASIAEASALRSSIWATLEHLAQTTDAPIPAEAQVKNESGIVVPLFPATTGGEQVA